MPPALTSEAFREITGVSRETLARFESYAALLKKWNPRINLVAESTLADLWRRHFLDSAQLQALLPPAPENRPLEIVDLGSGAGFPGLVLAILGAGTVTLLESDQRKTTFLREAARLTNTEVIVINQRIEAISAIPADVVTARALAPLPRLLSLAAPFLEAPFVQEPAQKARFGLFLKGRGVDRELTDSKAKWQVSVERFSSQSDPEGAILRIHYQ